MIALLIFSLVAAGCVWWAGRNDAALDPKLTTAVLALLAVFPVLVEMMPKIAVLPSGGSGGDFPWGRMVVAVWAVGFVISVARLLLAWRGIRLWRERSEIFERMGDVEVRKLEELDGPVAAGVFRKVVFVPADWSEWSTERRKIVLDHELAHHRRRDPLRRWIAGFAVAVNWFNPVVRWIVRRLLVQCEYACDAEVLKGGVSKAMYAEVLCDLADDRRMRGPALAMAERSGLESRVRRMMEGDRGNEGMGTSWLILFAVGMAGLLAILGAEKIAGYTAGEIHLRRTADPFPGR